MKHRTPLVLLELTVMLLVFSLVAVLCLQGFTWANAQSLEESQKDRALQQLQNTAELLKAGQSVPESLLFDENWQPAEENPSFILRMIPVEQEIPYLSTARLEVTKADGSPLGELTVSWQEVWP